MPPSLPLQWIGSYVMEGGLPKLLSRASNPWGNCYARGTILYFLLFDPMVRWGVEEGHGPVSRSRSQIHQRLAGQG